MTYWSVFQSLVSQMDHEDALLLARTQWLLTSQFLLLVAYFCVDKDKLPLPAPVNFHRTLSVLGIVSTIVILSAILAAVKLFVELRTTMFGLLSEHSDLPMRKLDPVGIGSGLLSPILLCLALVLIWSLLTFSSKLPALLLTGSCFLISFFIVVLAHELPDGTLRTVLLTTSGGAGLLLLIAALWLGRRSRPT